MKQDCKTPDFDFILQTKGVNMRLTKFIFSLMMVFLISSNVFADITELGYIQTPSYVMDVEVDGDYAYIPDYYYGLYIADISDPENPTQVSQVNIRNTYARAIDKQGDYVYTAEFYNGLGIYNVSDPENPTRVGNVRPAYYCYDIEVEGDYAYLVSYYYGLYILDISDPQDIFVVSNVNASGYEYSLSVENGIVCLANYYYGLVVIDATDPNDPVIQGSVTGARYRYSYGVDFLEGTAYIADTRFGMGVIDVSDPADPTEIGSIENMGTSYNVTVAGDYAFLANYSNGVRVIDVSDPANPTLAETYNTPYYAWNMRIHNGEAYLADYNYFMRILDVSEYIGQPEIDVEPEIIDFGEVEFRRVASEVLTIRNIGSTDLTVSNATLSGDYFDFDFDGEFVLAPDESLELNVSVNPEELGDLTGEIVISSDDRDEPEVTVAITVNCVWIPATELVERLVGVCGDLDLNRGQRNSLITKLEHILTKFNRGQIRPGLNQLNAFINHVTDFVEEGVLSAEDGGALIAEAQFIEVLVNDYGVDSLGDGTNLVNTIPDDFIFENCYPNPFNAETTVSFGLPEAEFVSIKVYDMSGRVVADLASSQYSASKHEISWHAQGMPAGNYLIHLNVGENNSVQKVTLIK